MFIDFLKDYYDTPEEVAEILNFIREKNIKIHATSTGNYSLVRAVLYNDPDADRRVLMVRKSELFNITKLNGEENYADAFKGLMTNMMEGDVLTQQGSHVIFENKYQAEEPFNDYRFYEGVFDLTSEHLPVVGGDPQINLFVRNGSLAWVNPCHGVADESVTDEATQVEQLQQEVAEIKQTLEKVTAQMDRHYSIKAGPKLTAPVPN